MSSFDIAQLASQEERAQQSAQRSLRSRVRKRAHFAVPDSISNKRKLDQRSSETSPVKTRKKHRHVLRNHIDKHITSSLRKEGQHSVLSSLLSDVHDIVSTRNTHLQNLPLQDFTSLEKEIESSQKKVRRKKQKKGLNPLQELDQIDVRCRKALHQIDKMEDQFIKDAFAFNEQQIRKKSKADETRDVQNILQHQTSSLPLNIKGFTKLAKVTRDYNAERYAAATRIQKSVRGMLGRMRVLRLMEDLRYKRIIGQRITVYSRIRKRVRHMQKLERLAAQHYRHHLQKKHMLQWRKRAVSHLLRSTGRVSVCLRVAAIYANRTHARKYILDWRRRAVHIAWRYEQIQTCWDRRFRKYVEKSFAGWHREKCERFQYREILRQIFLTTVPLSSHNSSPQLRAYKRAEHCKKRGYDLQTKTRRFRLWERYYQHHLTLQAQADAFFVDHNFPWMMEKWKTWTHMHKRVGKISSLLIHSHEQHMLYLIVKGWRKQAIRQRFQKQTLVIVITHYNARHWRRGFEAISKIYFAQRYVIFRPVFDSLQAWWQHLQQSSHKATLFFALKFFRRWKVYHEQYPAIQTLTRVWKATQLRRTIKNLNSKATKIQTWYRQLLASSILRDRRRKFNLYRFLFDEKVMDREIPLMQLEDLLLLNRSANVIQRFYRHCRLLQSFLKEEREFFKCMTLARKELAARKKREEREARNALLLQHQQKQQKAFEHAIYSLQCRFRWNQMRALLQAYVRKHQISACLRVQRVFRGRQQRRLFLAQRRLQHIDQHHEKMKAFQKQVLDRFKLTNAQKQLELLVLLQAYALGTHTYHIEEAELRAQVLQDWHYVLDVHVPVLREMWRTRSIAPFQALRSHEHEAKQLRVGDVVKIVYQYHESEPRFRVGDCGVLLHIDRKTQMAFVKMDLTQQLERIPLYIFPPDEDIDEPRLSRRLNVLTKTFSFDFVVHIPRVVKSEKWREALVRQAAYEREMHPKHLAATKLQQWYRARRFNYIFRTDLCRRVRLIERRRHQVFTLLDRFGVATLGVAATLVEYHLLPPEYVPEDLEDRELGAMDVLKGILASRKSPIALEIDRIILLHKAALPRLQMLAQEQTSELVVVLPLRKLTRSTKCSTNFRYNYLRLKTPLEKFRDQRMYVDPQKLYLLEKLEYFDLEKHKLRRVEQFIAPWKFTRLNIPRGTRDRVIFLGDWVIGKNKECLQSNLKGWIPHGRGTVFLPYWYRGFTRAAAAAAKEKAKAGDLESSAPERKPREYRMAQVECEVEYGMIKGNVEVQFADVLECELCAQHVQYATFRYHFEKDKMTLTKCKGPIYVGPLDEVVMVKKVDTRRHPGIWKKPDGMEIEGQQVYTSFQPEIATGKYLCRFPNGDSYDGDFVDGVINGYGQRNHVREGFSSFYVGEWKNGLYHGIGLYECENGVDYFGAWEYGNRHGFGKEHRFDRSVYEGFFKYDRQTGYGFKRWVNGDRYEGAFLNDMCHGHDGVFMGHTGERYTGGYVCGKRDGWGIWKMANGDLYHGFFRKGLQHGVGIFTKHNNYNGPARRMGKWKKGELLRWIYWIPEIPSTTEFCTRFQSVEDFKNLYSLGIARQLPHLPPGVNPKDDMVQKYVGKIVGRESFELIGDTTRLNAHKFLKDVSATFEKELAKVLALETSRNLLQRELAEMEDIYSQEKKIYVAALERVEVLRKEVAQHWKIPLNKESKVNLQKWHDRVLSLGSYDFIAVASNPDTNGDLRSILGSFLLCLQIRCDQWERILEYLRVSEVKDGIEIVKLRSSIEAFDWEWMADTNDGYRVYQEVAKMSKEDWFRPSNRYLMELKMPSLIGPILCNWILAAIDYTFSSLPMTLTRDEIKKLEASIAEYDELRTIETMTEINLKAFPNREKCWQIDLLLKMKMKEFQIDKLNEQITELRTDVNDLDERIQFAKWELEMVHQMRDPEHGPVNAREYLKQIAEYYLNQFEGHPYRL